MRSLSGSSINEQISSGGSDANVLQYTLYTSPTSVLAALAVGGTPAAPNSQNAPPGFLLISPGPSRIYGNYNTRGLTDNIVVGGGQ